MNDFEIVFYKRSNGECPVTDFLDSLNPVMRYKMLHALTLLEKYGNHPKGDFTKALGDGLYECRAQNRTDITRILFFFGRNRQIVLTHGFVKKTQRMPNSEPALAQKYRDDYTVRMEAEAQKDKRHPAKAMESNAPFIRPALTTLMNDAQEQRMKPGKTAKLKKEHDQR